MIIVAKYSYISATLNFSILFLRQKRAILRIISKQRSPAMHGGAKVSAPLWLDAAQRGRCACNFNYGYQRVSLIAGSPTRSPHVITL